MWMGAIFTSKICTRKSHYHHLPMHCLSGSEILPCRGRRVGPCRTCRGETCTGRCVCVLRSHLNLAICLCPKYLLTFSWLKSSYSKFDWVLGIQKYLILILFSVITLRNKETEDVELFCELLSCWKLLHKKVSKSSRKWYIVLDPNVASTYK